MQLEPTQLPDSKSKPLRKWLDQSEFDTLVEVLKSRALEHEFMAVKHRLEAADGEFPKYEEAAKAEIKQADAIRAALKILTDLKAEPDTKPITTTVIRP